MEDRHKLFETLRKIEALYAGAATPGERDAAASARERIRAKLKSVAEQERSEEYRVSMDNPWSRKIFVAFLRRYGTKPYPTVVNGETPSWPVFRDQLSIRRLCRSSTNESRCSLTWTASRMTSSRKKSQTTHPKREKFILLVVDQRVSTRLSAVARQTVELARSEGWCTIPAER
jgi:hypothetical protein